MANTTTDSVRIVLFDDNDNNSFLILSETDDPDTMKLPGGKFNSKVETPDDAAKRELYEELGLRDNDIELHEASMLLNDDGISKRYIFWGFCKKDLISPSTEIDQVKWITSHSIPHGKNETHIRSAVRVSLEHST